MKTIFIVRCLLCAALGAALGLSGVTVLSWRGAVVYGLLLAIALIDGLSEVRAYRKGREDGFQAAVNVVSTWGKP